MTFQESQLDSKLANSRINEIQKESWGIQQQLFLQKFRRIDDINGNSGLRKEPIQTRMEFKKLQCVSKEINSKINIVIFTTCHFPSKISSKNPNHLQPSIFMGGRSTPTKNNETCIFFIFKKPWS